MGTLSEAEKKAAREAKWFGKGFWGIVQKRQKLF